MARHLNLTIPFYPNMPVGNVWAWDSPVQIEEIVGPLGRARRGPRRRAARRRLPRLTRAALAENLYATAVSTGTVMFLVGMANVYSYVLSRERLPEMARDLLFSLSANRYVVLALIIAALLVLGCFLPTTPALPLSVPWLPPIVPQMGYDPVHFYGIVTITLILGTLTPPVAPSLYLASSIAAVAPARCCLSLIPYRAAMVFVLLLTVLFPGLIVWLPNLVFL